MASDTDGEGANRGALAEALGLDAVSTELLWRRSAAVAAPAGAVVFRAGEPCERLVLLTRGSVRVRMLSEGGREIQLYRVSPGDMCVMSISCLLDDKAFEAEGVCETDIEGRAVNAGAFRDLMGASAVLRERVLLVQTRRIHDLINLVDALAFRDTEERLASLLLARRDGAGDVSETHQALALDLGTAREVVSRRLKKLESLGMLRLERGRIHILDAARLQAISGVAG